MKDQEKKYDDCVGKAEASGTLADVFGFSASPETEEQALAEVANRNYQIALKAWKGMPTYDNSKVIEKKLTVSFDTDEDIIEFGKLIGIPLTPKTRGIRWPAQEREENGLRRYIALEE